MGYEEIDKYDLLESATTRTLKKLKHKLMNDNITVAKRLDFIHAVEILCEEE